VTSGSFLLLSSFSPLLSLPSIQGHHLPFACIVESSNTQQCKQMGDSELEWKTVTSSSCLPPPLGSSPLWLCGPEASTQ
jgi:hypothetical protein